MNCFVSILCLNLEFFNHNAKIWVKGCSFKSYLVRIVNFTIILMPNKGCTMCTSRDMSIPVSALLPLGRERERERVRQYIAQASLHLTSLCVCPQNLD